MKAQKEKFMNPNVSEGKYFSKDYTEGNLECRIIVHVCLQDLDQGPYFSVTGTLDKEELKSGWRQNVYSVGGCIHEDILQHLPDLKDAIALHLSTMDGVPMHCLENGYYYCTHIATESDVKYKSDVKVGELEFSDKVIADHFRIHESNVPELRKLSKVELQAWILTQMPRWKKEADEVIKKYNLYKEVS